MTEKPKHAKTPQRGPMKNKGFYAAVYGSVAVMLLIAAIIGYNNLNGSKPPEENLAVNPPSESDDASEVDHSLVESYLNPKAGNYLTGSELYGSEGYTGSAVTPKPANPGDPPSSSSMFDDDYDESMEALRQRPNKPTEASQAPEAVTPTQTAPPETSSETDQSLPASSGVTESGFAAFTDGSKMEWPVFGEVVMNYSMDHLIYDKTLEQYRTNNNLCIAAEAGTQVKASADGIVTDIFTSRELGKSVVIDHGNGWTTTYSQLQDNVLVNVGDVVKEGQVVGGVGDPSIYSQMLGNHLAFTISNADGYVNPNEVLRR